MSYSESAPTVLKIFPRAIRLKMEDVREAEKRYVASLGFGDV